MFKEMKIGELVSVSVQSALGVIGRVLPLSSSPFVECLTTGPKHPPPRLPPTPTLYPK